MGWLFYAFIAVQFFTISSFTDKHIVSNVVKDYTGLPVYSSIIALVLGTVFWLAAGFPILSILDMLLLIFAGALNIWTAFSYYEILTDTDVSLIMFLFQSQPVFILILSIIFLHQFLPPVQLLGFAIIIISVMFIALSSSSGSSTVKKKLNKKQVLLALLITFGWAVNSVLINYVLTKNVYVKTISFESWGMAVGGITVILFSKKVRKAFVKSFDEFNPKLIVTFVANDGIFTIGKLFGMYANSLGPVALISAVGSTQTLFGTIYGFLLTKFLPSKFREDISHKGLLKKFFAAILIGVGIYLIS